MVRCETLLCPSFLAEILRVGTSGTHTRSQPLECLGWVGTEQVLGLLHLVSRSLGLPAAAAAFEVAAPAWCADGAGAFQPAECPGLELLLLHVVPEMLMRRKHALDRARRCSFHFPVLCASGDHRVLLNSDISPVMGILCVQKNFPGRDFLPVGLCTNPASINLALLEGL